MNRDSCAACRFARADGSGNLRCRRNSPRVVTLDDGNDGIDFGAVWPVVAHDDWCGEFRPDGAATPGGSGS